jgi:hypothetical protein
VVDAATVSVLEDKGYDHAPVTTAADVAIGIIATSTARRLLESSIPLEASSPAINPSAVPLHPSLDALLGALSTTEAVLVTPEPGGHVVLGLLTLSDLNRHLFRANLYQSLARLEARLARAVEQHFRDPWEWLESLNEDGQAAIVGRWEILKRRGLDVGPVVAANLPHLLNIVRKSRPLLEELGFSSGSAFEKATGRIPEVRNSVMHLTRPLILGLSDVARLRETLRVVTNMCRELGEEELW